MIENNNERRMKIDVEVDSKAFKELAEENAELKHRLEDTKKQLEKLQNKEHGEIEIHMPDVVGHGGAGNVPLSHNLSNPDETESWDSIEEMMFDLSNRASLGDKKAIEAKQAFTEKFVRALDKLPKGVIYDEQRDLPKELWQTEPSLLKKVLNHQNERVRRKMLKLRGQLH